VPHVPVPAGVNYRRSSFSGGGNCVEVGALEDQVYVRNSRYTGEPIRVSADSWSIFLGWLKSGGPTATTPATSEPA
jgi:hypothetical protein